MEEMDDFKINDDDEVASVAYIIPKLKTSLYSLILLIPRWVQQNWYISWSSRFSVQS